MQSFGKLLPILYGDFFGSFATLQRVHLPLAPRSTFWPHSSWTFSATPRTSFVCFDIFDVFEQGVLHLSHGLTPLLSWLSVPCKAAGLALCFNVFLVLAGVLAAHVRWQRPFASRHARRLHGTSNTWTRLLLILGTITRTGAAPHDVTARTYNSEPSSWRRPGALDLWRDGLMTPFETLLQAEQSHLLSAPLHSMGEIPTRAHAAGPTHMPRPPPEPPDTPDEGNTDQNFFVDLAETFHISCWICSPGFEPCSIDIAVHFPQTLDRLGDIVKETIDGLSPSWLEHLYPIAPQVDDSGLGSFLYNHSPARIIERPLFAFYLSVPATRFNILAQLGFQPEDPYDIYIGGSTEPLIGSSSLSPPQGSLVKIIPRGDTIEWVDHLTDRLADPLLWDPDDRHPDTLPGRYIELQTRGQTKLHRVGPDDRRPPDAVASQAFGLPRDQFWVRAPTHRPLGMYNKGYHIHSVVAVVDQALFPAEHYCVVFLDLRPIGRWVLWEVARDGDFDVGAFIESLQIEAVEGYAVVVHGDIQRGRRNVVQVNDGEVLEVALVPTASLSTSSTSPTSTGHSDNDEGDGDTESGNGGPDSSDLSPTGPPTGPGPFGPPRPSPVNRPRSRSPRGPEHAAPEHPREEGQVSTTATPAPSSEGDGARLLHLANYLEPPTFSLEAHTVPLPHVPTLAATFTEPWPLEWLHYDLVDIDLPEVTSEALISMATWADLILDVVKGAPPALHIYCDGSWDPDRAVGGYAVAIFLVANEQWALFGMCGQGTHGHHTGWDVDGPPALVNEQIAIAVALLWTAQTYHFLRHSAVTIHYDCQVAGYAAQGTTTSTSAFMSKVRDLCLFVAAIFGDAPSFEYVAAHKGEPLNELVDAAAKACARHRAFLPHPPEHVYGQLLANDTAWLAAPCDRRWSKAVPVTATAIQWCPVETYGPSPLRPDQLIPTTTFRTEAGKPNPHGTLKFLSLNALGMAHKHRYFEDQLDQLEIGIACFQETKGSEGLCESARYVRLTSASDRHWGVAIWLSKRRGAITIEGKPWIAGADDLKVLLSSPRLLAALIIKDDLKFLVLSGHCPHDAKYEEAAQFVADLRRVVAPYRNIQLILAGLDLNGRPPPGVLGITGTLECGEADRIGHLATDAFQDLGLWIPSTFPEIHEGQVETYRLHRIDFAVTGGSATVLDAYSTVDTSFDSGCERDDHWPVVLELSVDLGPIQHRARLSRPRFDIDKLMSTEGRQLMAQELRTFVQPSWDQHPDLHCQAVQDHFLDIMKRHFPLAKHRPRASYIPTATWELRDRKLRLKTASRHRRGLWEALVHRAFLQWREGADYDVHTLVSKHGFLYQLTAAAVSFATHKIKEQIRTAKNTFLLDLAGDTHRPAGALLRQAKEAGVGGAKSRPVARPLPLLLRKDGSAVVSRHDRDSLWTSHFGAQELGTTLSTTEYLAQPQCPPYQDTPLEWKIEDIPSLQDVERAFRAAPRKKSPGLDCICGEMLSAAPAEAASIVWPLFVKAAVQVCQPTQWRGGILYAAYKRSGCSWDPQAHRSLFVSSTIGKSFHKTCRTRVQNILDSSFHSFHLGARRNCPVTMPALYILGHMRRGRESRRSTSTLYLDTEAAYYRVTRQLAFGDLTEDDAVIRVFQHFDLPPEDVGEMMEQVCAGGMAAETSLPHTTRHNVKDFHSRAFFVTAYADGTHVTQTDAGSRPGESWSDIVFGWVYSRILARITEHATAENILDELPCDPSAGPYAVAGEGTDISIADATWADDSAWPLSADTPEALVRKTIRMCSLVLTFCWQHGLKPNLRPGKSAVMMILRGKGKQRTRAAHFPKDGLHLPIPECDVCVPITNSYKHLGGLVDGEAKMAAEARRRTAMAGSAYDAGKKLFFANWRLPFSTRVALFQAAIDPVYFNLGLWTTDTPSWKALSEGYSRLLRRLVVKQWNGEHAFHVPLPAIHLATSSPPLEHLLRRARLSLLASMARAAPEPLWAILQTERTWLAEVRQDLEWLSDGHGDKWPHRSEAGWPEWAQLFRQSGSWVKRQVKRRMQESFDIYKQAQRCNLTLWALYRKALAITTPPTGGQNRWACRGCSKSFRSRAGLGAHYFKVHGRVADHRGLIAGTVCAACGKDYHSENRLSIHLRDTPHCQHMLRAAGYRTESVRPGLGSRAWNKAAQTMDKLAVPAETHQPIEGPTESPYSETAKSAYACLSETLLSRSLPRGFEAIQDLMLGHIAEFPLYPEETAHIVDRLLADFLDLKDELIGDYWTDETYYEVQEAFHGLPGKLEATAPPPTEGSDHAEEFWRFVAGVDGFQWERLLPQHAESHGTPNDRCFSLHSAWEAEWHSCSDTICASAVEQRLWPLVPATLREVWELAVQGHRVALNAPACFWQCPLSRPFSSLRQPVALN
ncbi:unnamed protein product [Symbiodinium sp. CCMP2592]|nr:unnamed protein product [Symbiodinium sp. CCMP2592]